MMLHINDKKESNEKSSLAYKKNISFNTKKLSVNQYKHNNDVSLESSKEVFILYGKGIHRYFLTAILFD